MRNLNKPGQFEWVRRSLSFGTFKFWFGCFDYTLNSLPLSKKKILEESQKTQDNVAAVRGGPAEALRHAEQL